MSKLLSMEHIVKRFGNFTALRDVHFDVDEGEIHALVGENGAGKSTLMNVLSGIYPYGTYEGEIVYDGKVSRFHRIKDSEKQGIVIIHQELAMIPLLTIGENVFLGNERGNAANIDWDTTYSEAAKYLEMVGLKENPHTLIKDISIGKQQLVEIAKALSKNVRLLILDEPTASLNEDDSQKLLKLLLTLKEKGVTSILISHKLNEIRQVANRITVVRDGSTIETIINQDISEDRIIKGMVGRELNDRYPSRTPKIGAVSLEVIDWHVDHPLYDRKVVNGAGIKLHKGEVVGISGLMGAGRSELAMSVFGGLYGRNAKGAVKLNGEDVKFKSAREAIKHKLAYVTEDRKNYGLVLSNPIRSNTTLANMERTSKRGTIDTDLEIRHATDYVKRLHVKCDGIEQEVGALSGGNQQKVLLAKWMYTEPDILILDEPTRGIDVGAKYEIYCFINELVESGKSVLMISSEMPELLGMCDRIYVMNEGRIVAEYSQAEATQEKIMEKILGSAS